MANLNVVVLTGRLTEDPELLAASDGAPVTILHLAVTRPKPAGGSKKPEVDHVDVIVRNGDADTVARYLANNCRVGIRGRLYERTWEDDEGRQQSRLHVAADPGGVEFIDWKDRGEQTATRAAVQLANGAARTPNEPAAASPEPAAPASPEPAAPASPEPAVPASPEPPATAQASDAAQATEEVIVWADGGSRGNPGPAGYGALITSASTGDVLAELREGIGWATNNVAEYRGVIAGLEHAQTLGARRVVVRADSKLVIRQLSGGYKVQSPALIPLHAKARQLTDGFEEVVFEHIAREANQRADLLANRAMDDQGEVTDPAKVAAAQSPAQDAGATQDSATTVPDGTSAVHA